MAKVRKCHELSCEAAFLCWYWTIHGLPDHGYSRHFKFLKDVPVQRPPLKLQQSFVERLNDVVSIFGVAEKAATTAEATRAALMSRLFAS